MELTKTYQRISTINVYLDGAKVGEIRTYGKYTSQSIQDNTTSYKLKQTFWYNQSSQYYYGVSSATGTLDGTAKKYTSYTRFYGGETQIQEIDRTITHNIDGTTPTKNVATSWVDSVGHNLSTNVNITFPNIDRYPIITEAPNFSDEDNPKVKYSTINGFEESTTQIGIFSSDGNTAYISYRNVTVADGEYTFNLTTSERNTLRQNCTGKTMTVMFKLKTTASGTDYISSSSKTLTVINANPTFTLGYKDTNATTKAITNNDQQIIQNNSTLQINITSATALKSATLSSVSVNINGAVTTESISSSTKNINIGTLNLANNTNAVVTLTDSRGNTTTQTVELTILAWQLPTAIITCNRKQNFYTATDITVDADYSSLDNKNTITLQYRIKKTSEGSYGVWNNLSDNVTSTFNADNQYSWDIQVKVQDSLGTTTYNLSVGIGIPIMFVDKVKRSLGINCFPSEDNSIEIDDINLVNTFTYSSNEIAVGKWVDGSIVYRKVLESNGSTGSSVTVAHGITGLDRVIKLDASATGSGGTTYMLNNPTFVLQCKSIDSTNINMNVASAFGSGWTIKYIIEYTKQ